MKNHSIKDRKKLCMLLILLLAVMLLPFGSLAEASVTTDSVSESLFDDDEYYGWLYGDEEDAVT